MLDGGWVPQKQTLRWGFVLKRFIKEWLTEETSRGRGQSTREITTPEYVCMVENGFRSPTSVFQRVTEMGCQRQRLGEDPPQTGK